MVAVSNRNSHAAKAKRRAKREADKATAEQMEADIAMFNAYLVIGFMLRLGGSDWLEQTRQPTEEVEPA